MDPTIVNDPQYSNSVRSGLASIPSMSIILPIPDLFDPDIGIYTHPQNRSVGWERACSMELIFPDGSSGAQLDCGLQIQGGTQRDPAKNAKHSFRVNFKGDYGSAKFNFPMFADSPVQSFNTFVLDGGINYWWNYVGGNVPARPALSRPMRSRPVHQRPHARPRAIPPSMDNSITFISTASTGGCITSTSGPTRTLRPATSAATDRLRRASKTRPFGTQIRRGDLDAWNSSLALSQFGPHQQRPIRTTPAVCRSSTTSSTT